MTAILLLFPAAVAALACGLARRLDPAERGIVALSGLLLAVSAALSPVAPVHDPWTHYLHLRASLADPRRLLDLWDRPGFTLLAAGPAALGIHAARFAAILTALVAIAATVRSARALGFPRPWLAGALLVAQHDFFGQGTSTMTELPFAAALAIAILGWTEGRPWVVAAGLGWLGITRPEGPAFVALGALALAVRWRRAGPAIAAGIPLLLYVAVGAAVFANPRWFLDANPYRALVGLQLELPALARSWFFRALVYSQGPALALVEGAGALLAAAGVLRSLRFLLAPVGLTFLVLTFVRIGPTEAWLESRYLVAVGPALALLAAGAIDVALARAPRAAPPLLLAVGALGAAWSTCWHWGQIGAWHGGLLEALAAGALALAALLWLARRTIPARVGLSALLLGPLLAVPPGVLSRHRAEVAPGAPAPDLADLAPPSAAPPPSR